LFLRQDLVAESGNAGDLLAITTRGRFVNEKRSRLAKLKVVLSFLLTLGGISQIYSGDKIAMRQQRSR
jgi:hypothetical protein